MPLLPARPAARDSAKHGSSLNRTPSDYDLLIPPLGQTFKTISNKPLCHLSQFTSEWSEFRVQCSAGLLGSGIVWIGVQGPGDGGAQVPVTMTPLRRLRQWCAWLASVSVLSSVSSCPLRRLKQWCAWLASASVLSSCLFMSTPLRGQCSFLQVLALLRDLEYSSEILLKYSSYWVCIYFFFQYIIT